LVREGHHGAHRAHGEEGRELKVESWPLKVDLFLIQDSLLGVLEALCGPKKPPKKPHGVRAWTSEPEASAPGATAESTEP
jgi:hypothetical protein